jgi:hypothetical protein
MTRFWIAVVSRDHALRGVKGGFIQACHGRRAPAMRMQTGDYILVYSLGVSVGAADKWQKFTAAGRVTGHEAYQVRMLPDFLPFRRRVAFYPSRECAISPLIAGLDFIRNKKKWGYPFLFGFFEIGEKDFTLIASKRMIDEKQGAYL